jgi:hypothetical protein
MVRHFIHWPAAIPMTLGPARIVAADRDIHNGAWERLGLYLY